MNSAILSRKRAPTPASSNTSRTVLSITDFATTFLLCCGVALRGQSLSDEIARVGLRRDLAGYDLEQFRRDRRSERGEVLRRCWSTELLEQLGRLASERPGTIAHFLEELDEFPGRRTRVLPEDVEPVHRPPPIS